jgi:peptidoglycan/LPS O-acetylase OafA/YrhL
MPAGPAATGRPRLSYLDGLRALAAFYVVLFHAALGFPRGELEGAWRILRRLLAFGHEAVAVFIVLSGYCLMLPVVNGGGDRLPRSVSSFIGRRAFRILPPYYVTVALCLLLIAVVPELGQPGSGTIWDDSLPGLEWGAVVSHLVLLHNWVPRWAFQIDGPLWSVATEWQIYFFFPLLLLPLWRRSGAVACIAAAAAVGYAPLLFARAPANAAIPWYLALFALGMVAAAIVHSQRPLERALKSRVNWRVVSLALWAGCAVFGLGFGAVFFRWKPLTDPLVGAATAALLVHLGVTLERGGRGGLIALLESGPVASVGRYSYSLYLTHLPILALTHVALVRLELSAPVHALMLLAVGTLASLAIAFVFYLLVERHFIGAPRSPFSKPGRRSAATHADSARK